jgi:pimeloyl-ACP methyl ester carboxylesterase
MTGTTKPVIQVTERFVEIEGMKVRFLHAGSGSPLVLLHGLLGYSFSWRLALPILAQQREVFAVDMPGSGFSDCPRNLDACLTTAADRLAKIIDGLGIDDCDLVGSSYGGATALKFAELYPSRVRSLILVSPANPWSRIGRKRLAMLGIPLVSRVFPTVSRRFRFLHPFFVRRMYGDPKRISAETLRGYSLPLFRDGVLEHAVKITRTWRADMRDLKEAMPEAAPIPVLVVWGSRDRLVDFSSAEKIAQNFKSARVAVIEGAGHLPYEEYPEQFCAPVLEFLATHSPTAGTRQEVT